MPRWLPLGSAQRLAALLLLFGVMLGGGLDAIVCEPSTEIAVAAVYSANHDSHEQGPDSVATAAAFMGIATLARSRFRRSLS